MSSEAVMVWLTPAAALTFLFRFISKSEILMVHHVLCFGLLYFGGEMGFPGRYGT